jgi:hypothetical protein
MHDGSLSVPGIDSDSLRKIQTFGVLERICQRLELTETQFQTAKSRYESTGAWLAQSNDPVLQSSEIYPQGSTAIGTTIKPVGRNEHDVDLINLLVGATPDTPPALVKKVVGDRLRANGRYATILTELQRCWCLSYANEFHLDITPAIRNPDCPNGGELVPDKALKAWKASNPKGFRDKFLARAKLQATFLVKSEGRVAADAQIAPFPTKSAFKGVLPRTIQLAKRHRDIAFEKLDRRHAPLSVIVTQLAGRSYEYCIRHFTFESELDLLLTTLRLMTTFIEKEIIGGREHYFVWNETTVGENFAEKWNSEPERARAFYWWHRKVVADFERLLEFEGMDALAAEMSETLGDDLVRSVMDEMTAGVSELRGAGRLGVTATGLAALSFDVARATVVPAVNAVTPVRPNTFFGAAD